MELSFAHQTERQISVTCNGQPSHTFDLQPIMLKSEEELFSNHEAYGEKLYEALFPPETPARHALDAEAERVLLVAPDDDLDAIPWEYIHGPNGFLVQELHFVRGLPAEQRLQPPLLDTGLHIIAVPSNPLSSRLASLNINAEWTRLKEIVEEIGRSLHCALTLERTRPPTLEQVRNAVSGQRHRVMHFMGHGGQVEQGAVLCFE